MLDCPEGAATSIAAAAADWVFRPGEPTDRWLSPIPLSGSRKATKRTQPSFPKEAKQAEAKCTAILSVDEGGTPLVRVMEEGCPDLFDKEVREVMAKWRFEKSSEPTVERITITFRRR